jgi:hypothetical protein
MPVNDDLARHSVADFMRRNSSTVKLIPLSQLIAECRAFEEWDPRDSVYQVSTFLVREWWGDPTRLVGPVTVLLIVWNWGFYRFGYFSESSLEECLRHNEAKLNAFRDRSILSFTEADEADTECLFNSLSKALKSLRRRGDRESPVSAAKALHLLAPNFFPLWDQYIAPAYGCPYWKPEVASVAYLAFTRRIKQIATQLDAELQHGKETLPEWFPKKTFLKRIDEYNYRKFTIAQMDAARTVRKSAEAGATQ